MLGVAGLPTLGSSPDHPQHDRRNGCLLCPALRTHPRTSSEVRKVPEEADVNDANVR